jgi:hypothetical protein
MFTSPTWMVVSWTAAGAAATIVGVYTTQGAAISAAQAAVTGSTVGAGAFPIGGSEQMGLVGELP